MDQRQKFRARISVSGFFFLHGLCFSSWSSRIPAIQQALEMSATILGTALFAVPVGSMVSLPLASRLVQHFGSRTVLLAAMSFYTLVLVTLGYAPSASWLAVALFFYGLSSNIVNISVNTQAIGVEKLFGRSVMSSFHGTWSLAGFLGAIIGTLMIGLEVRPVHHFVIILFVECAAVISLKKNLLPDSVSRLVGVENEIEKISFYKRLIPDRRLVILGLIAMCSMICEGAMFDWGGIYFQTVIEAKAAWVGAGYVAFMSAMASTRFVADRLRGRWGITTILRACGILIVSGFVGSIVFPTFWVGVLSFILIGAGTSAVVPLVYSEAGQDPRLSVSAAIAAVSSIGFLGFLAGPPIIGWVAGLTSLRVSFFLMGIMGLGVSILASKILSSNQRSEALSITKR